MRINAAARREGMSYSELIHGLNGGRGRGEPQDARRHRRARPRGVSPICRASPGGRGGLSAAEPPTTTLPGARAGRPFCSATDWNDDDHQPRQREAEAGPQARRPPPARARGAVRRRGRGPGRGRPRPRAASRELVLPRRDRRRRGRAGAARLGLRPRLGHPGDRGLARTPGPTARRPRLRLPARRRRPRQRRRDRPLGARARRRRSSCSGPAAPIPTRPKAVRASMGSIFGASRSRVPRSPRRRRPGSRWSRTAATRRTAGGRRRSASAPSARGCPTRSLAACERRWTIPLRPGGAESLNVAAAAAIALAADIVAAPDAGPDREPALGGGPAAIADGRRRRRRSTSCGSGYLGRSSELTGILRGIAELPRRARAGGQRPPTPHASSSRRRSSRPPAELEGAEIEAAPRDRGASTSPCPGTPPVPVGHLHLLTPHPARDRGRLRRARATG